MAEDVAEVIGFLVSLRSGLSDRRLHHGRWRLHGRRRIIGFQVNFVDERRHGHPVYSLERDRGLRSSKFPVLVVKQ